jgi:phosphohistidine phosphatase SixA
LKDGKNLVNKVCNWCSDPFISTSKNQIYCSKDCRTESTKQKIGQRYQVAKAKSRIGKERKCAGNCETLISIYNNQGFCNSCLINVKKVDKFVKDLRDYFDYEEK